MYYCHLDLFTGIDLHVLFQNIIELLSSAQSVPYLQKNMSDIMMIVSYSYEYDNLPDQPLMSWITILFLVPSLNTKLREKHVTVDC